MMCFIVIAESQGLAAQQLILMDKLQAYSMIFF